MFRHWTYISAYCHSYLHEDLYLYNDRHNANVFHYFRGKDYMQWCEIVKAHT